MSTNIKLGMRVTDFVSGFHGTVTARYEDVSGTIKFKVTNKVFSKLNEEWIIPGRLVETKTHPSVDEYKLPHDFTSQANEATEKA